MLLWRISNHQTLDGRGGLTASARWHTQGRPVVYFAETPASALIEALVHLELAPASFPRSYRLLKANAPDSLPQQAVAETDLSKDWIHDAVVTRTIGDEWLASKATALLRVPSAIVPETSNVLLNPEHADAASLLIIWHEEFSWDTRLISK